jgi:uncharacterized protein (DUF1684 family)
MLTRCKFFLLSFSLAWILPATIPAQPAASFKVTTDESLWREQLATWRAQREKQIAAPDGWLTLSGLEWLNPGVNSIGAASDNRIVLRLKVPDHIGLITVSGQTVQLLSPTGGFPSDLTIDGRPAREGPLVVDNVTPSTIAWHGITMVVLNRSGRFVLRIKDADSASRKAFHGLNWYPPDPNFSVKAKWIPFARPHTEKIPTVIGATLDLPAPGIAEFSLGGKTFRLEPVMEDPSGKTLFFILRDATSTTRTYGGGRFLYSGLPDHGLAAPGSLILDFNRLENPPCAYTNYATCPLPPEQNRLQVALEAGEQRYTQ